jgi:hypothetical protein
MGRLQGPHCLSIHKDPKRRVERDQRLVKSEMVQCAQGNAVVGPICAVWMRGWKDMGTVQ